MKNKSELLNDQVKVSLLKSDIIVVEYCDDCTVTIGMARSISRAIGRVAEGKQKNVLHLPGRYTMIEEGVREYFHAISSRSRKVADAFVVRNLQQRISANFYLRVNRPGYPTQYFNSKEEALTWLNASVAKN